MNAQLEVNLEHRSFEIWYLPMLSEVVAILLLVFAVNIIHAFSRRFEQSLNWIHQMNLSPVELQIAWEDLFESQTWRLSNWEDQLEASDEEAKMNRRIRQINLIILRFACFEESKFHF